MNANRLDKAENRCNAMRKYNALKRDLDNRYSRGRISWEDYITMHERAQFNFKVVMEANKT